MASYPPPNPQQGTIFNTIDWIEPNAGSIDTAYLNEHYCQFPVAQGSMSFAGINNTGSTTIKQNLVMTGTPNVNYIEFPNGTKQYTASSGADILDTDNTFIGVNTFSPLPLQPYGSIMNEGLTITNNQSNAGTGLGTQLISYTPTGTIGFSIFSLASTNTTTGAPPSLKLLPNGVSSVLQAQGTNGIAELNASGTGGSIILQSSTGVKLQISPLINFNNWGTLSATSNDGIKSNVNLTSTSFIINDTVNDVYQFYSQNSPNYGMVIANTSGGLGTLTLSNGSTTLTTLTSTTTGLSVNDSIIVPSQTYPLTSSNQVATISYVNSAITSQGGGDASLSATQTFTGINTFSQGVNLPAQNYNPSFTYGNVASTQEFVQEAILDGTFTGLISVNVSNAVGFESGYAPPAFNFTQTINTKQQTNNYYMVSYSSIHFTAGTPIGFTLTFPSFLYPIGTTPTFLSGTGINCFSPTTLQTFNLQISFLNNTSISCTSGGTTTGSNNYTITGQFYISWT